MNTLGTITPDPVSETLGTGYFRFASIVGCVGLGRVEGDHLHILAIESKNPASGQLRAFMTCAKSEFTTITVWEVWNPALADILARYGFVRVTEETYPGESNDGWRWKSSPDPS
jgi:hypothetical protein